MTRALGVLLALLVSWTSAAAHAQLPLELTWEVPESCPDLDAVRSELERIVVLESGRTPSPLVARGAIERTSQTFRLTLETEQEGVRGDRTLVATDCRDLLRAATLVLALAFGEGVALRTDEPRSAGAPAREVESSAAPSPSSAEPRATPRAARDSSQGGHDALRAAVFIELGAIAGLLPEASFLGGLGAELGNDFARARLRVAAAPGGATQLGADARAEFVGMLAGAEGCAGAPLEALRGEACAGVVFYGIHARAQGLAEQRDAFAPLVALRAALTLALAIERVEVRLVGGLEWATSRPRFEVVGVGAVHVVSELIATGALGIAWAP